MTAVASLTRVRVVVNHTMPTLLQRSTKLKISHWYFDQCLYLHLSSVKNILCNFFFTHIHLMRRLSSFLPRGAMHSAYYAIHLSVCPSVTCRYSVETAKPIIKLFPLWQPHHSSISKPNRMWPPTGPPPNGDVECKYFIETKLKWYEKNYIETTTETIINTI